MSKSLFKPVQENYDGRGRIVFVCQDKTGFYVYKPATGYRSTHFKKGKALDACFERQVCCNHNNAFYEANEMPAAEEQYAEPEEA